MAGQRLRGREREDEVAGQGNEIAERPERKSERLPGTR